MSATSGSAKRLGDPGPATRSMSLPSRLPSAVESSVTSRGPEGLASSPLPLGLGPGADDKWESEEQRGQPETEMGLRSDKKRGLESKGEERVKAERADQRHWT